MNRNFSNAIENWYKEYKRELPWRDSADIVNEIAKNTGVDKVTVLTTVEAFMDAVKDSLSKDENVYLRGFGSFVYNICFSHFSLKKILLLCSF